MNAAALLYRCLIAPRGPGYWHWRHFGFDYRAQQELDSWRVQVLGRKIRIPSTGAAIKDPDALHIVLSGPSASALRDPVRLGCAPTICVNGSYRILRDAGLRPSLYLVTDGGFARRQWDSFRAGMDASEATCVDHRLLLQIARRDPTCLDRYRFCLFDNLARPYGRPSLKWRAPQDPEVRIRDAECAFSFSARSGFFTSRTVAYPALQLAAVQRPRRIVLFGLDLGGGRRFYDEAVPERSMLEQDYETSILPHLRFASQVLAGAGIEVLNASPASRLPDDIFRRIDPDLYLDGCGDSFARTFVGQSEA